MPPRIRRLSPQCLFLQSSSSSTKTQPSSWSSHHLFLPSSTTTTNPSSTPSHQRRYASHDQGHRITRLRRQMWAWLNGPGAAFKQPLESSTNYLSAYDSQGRLIRASQAIDGKLPAETADDLRPFPLNRQFRSQPVLSEELREAVWRDVVEKGLPLMVVSAAYGISNERVGAVVRLKSLEKEWVKEGKPLAKPYSRAVLSMIPTTPYVSLDAPRDSKNESSGPTTPPMHESINDLPVHPATRPQIFYPAPESRHFTREHAARVFDPSLPLLPADKRIPHPELVEIERDRLQGLPREEMEARQVERMQEAADRKARAEARREREEKKTAVVQGRRWDFKFQDISVEQVGKDGRSKSGVGWRYGVPHQDRKKGQVKIPTKVEG